MPEGLPIWVSDPFAVFTPYKVPLPYEVANSEPPNTARPAGVCPKLPSEVNTPVFKSMVPKLPPPKPAYARLSANMLVVPNAKKAIKHKTARHQTAPENLPSCFLSCCIYYPHPLFGNVD